MTADRLAIIAGQGALPDLLAAAFPDALYLSLSGTGTEPTERMAISPNRFGEIFSHLKGAHIRDIVFAGGLQRPVLDPAQFDDVTQRLAPSLIAAMQGGDDHLLRTVFSMFEEQGFVVRGAHDLLPDLTAEPGLLVGPAPTEADRHDADRGCEVLAALGAADIGQAVVVARRLVLGVETAQGTDAMLRFVAETSRDIRQGARGVLVKAPKPGQDLRIDMPAIGPATIAATHAAGLAGIVIAARSVLILDRAATCAAARAAGVFLWAQDL